MSEKEAPPPPPPTYTDVVVTMVRRPPAAPPVPAYDAPVPESRPRRWLARARDVARRLLTRDPAPLTGPAYADWTVNDFLHAGYPLASVRDAFGADTVESLVSIGLDPPLAPALWARLADEYGLEYGHLEPLWDLVNVLEYDKAGLSPYVLADSLSVTVDGLLADARLDATALGTWHPREWKRLGLAFRHAPRLGLTPESMAAVWGMSTDVLAAYLREDGDYLLTGAGHKHTVSLEEGTGVSSFNHGHTHVVTAAKGVLPAADGHTHDMQRIISQ